MFAAGPAIVGLFLARVLSGFSAGLVTAAATVALVELAGPARQSRATLLAAAINMLGLGCGPLLGGLLAALAPDPLRLPFLIDLALLAGAAWAIWRTPETVPDRASAWTAALRPRRPSVPAEARAAFVPAALAIFAAFAVFGLLTAVEPGLLIARLHLPNSALAGAVVFAMFAGSAIGQLASARLTTHVALPAGCVILIAGLAAIAAGLYLRSLTLLALWTIIVGLGHGASFRSGMTAITEHTGSSGAPTPSPPSSSSPTSGSRCPWSWSAWPPPSPACTPQRWRSPPPSPRPPWSRSARFCTRTPVRGGRCSQLQPASRDRPNPLQNYLSSTDPPDPAQRRQEHLK